MDKRELSPEEEEQNELAKEQGMYEIRETGNSYDPLFSYRIKGEGPEFQFTLANIPEEHREWLSTVVYKQLYQAYQHGRKSQLEDIQKALAVLLFQLGLQIPQNIKDKGLR